ncbi:MAG: hypothetical protein ACREBK_01635, partial [Sphingomicrobium sp.]
MNTTQRRIALLTGVSAVAMGVPSVAQAAVNYPSNDYFFLGGALADTVNICLDNPPNPDFATGNCFY